MEVTTAAWTKSRTRETFPLLFAPSCRLMAALKPSLQPGWQRQAQEPACGLCAPCPRRSCPRAARMAH